MLLGEKDSLALSPDGRKLARTFAAGAAFGFLIGAFVVTFIALQFGNASVPDDPGVTAAAAVAARVPSPRAM